MSYGTLAQRPELRTSWPWPHYFDESNIPLPPTRPEEYNFALSQPPSGGISLDAASGWVPDWHIFARNFALHHKQPLIAMDLNPEHLWLHEPHPLIVRTLGDICGMPFAEAIFDTVYCLSALEHLPGMYLSRAVEEVSRVARCQLVLTFDGLDLGKMVTTLTSYGFDCGIHTDEDGEALISNSGRLVNYVTATRVT